MYKSLKKPNSPLVIYTDLDGTLLDHDSYSFEAALPALKRLESAGVPVIPVTSKTLAELDVLTRSLGLQGPVIAENGGLIAVPHGYFEQASGLEDHGRFQIEYLSPRYARIVEMLNEVRSSSGFNFAGFSDLSDNEVAGLTGLDREESQRARQRLCSEPLVWHDSDAAFETFTDVLCKRNYTLVKGGRFCHVLGATDKALAIDKLNHRFSGAGFTGFTTIILGDSPNDRQMLAAADIAVIVRRKDGTWLEVDCRGEKILTQACGPEGWNEFFQTNLDRLTAQSNAQRTLHG